MTTTPNTQLVTTLRTVLKIANMPWPSASQKAVFQNVDLTCPFCGQETVTGQEPHAQRCEGAS